MNVFRHWRFLAALVLLILASGVAGGLIGHRMARQRFDLRNDPAHWNEHVAREFDRLVQPSPEQATRIQAHLDEAVLELQRIRLETIGRSTNVIWRLVDQVERELTPEQKQAFQAMKPKPADLTLDLLQVKPNAEPGR